MGKRYETISFLSDYGTVDEFAGVVTSVARTIAPHATVVDVTHDIAPHDVRAGSLALMRAAQYLAPGVVLAIVDPGVGTDRRAIAVEVGGGERVYVGPDNGLLGPAVAMTGGADRAVELTNATYQLPAPGPTFAGRDVFGPAAAHLCNGVDLDELGTSIGTNTLLPSLLPLTTIEDGALHSQVLWIDRYGNVQLNVDPDEIAFLGERFVVRWGAQGDGGNVRAAIRARTYGDLEGAALGVIVDSYGLVSLAFDQRSAARELHLRTGDSVVLAPAS